MASIEGSRIQLCDLPFYLQRPPAGSSQQNQTSIRDVHARAEKEAIVFALKETANNKAKAAKMLGIHRTHLYKKMKKYRISLDAET
jgi:transcriptional regulator with PAS, ATPase and Fis domain